jgi:hypothetical protein
MHLTIFDEGIFLNHFSELFLIDEEIVLAMHFPYSRGSSGIRDTETEQVRVVAGQSVNKSSLFSLRLP